MTTRACCCIPGFQRASVHCGAMLGCRKELLSRMDGGRLSASSLSENRGVTTSGADCIEPHVLQPHAEVAQALRTSSVGEL